MKKSLLFGLTLFVAAACSSDKDEPTPSNVIETETGLTVELEWSTGSTTSDALSSADLDLYLMKGTTEIASSETASQFEDVVIQDAYADAEYLVQVEAFETSKNANYTLYVKGDQEGEVKTYTGSFVAGDTGVSVDFLKIKKTGNSYTITEL